MKCLYISNSRQVMTPYRDGSTRYRCYNVAEELSKLQYIAHVVPFFAVDERLIQQYDVAVFLRPAISRRLTSLLDLCERHGIITVADYDDLIFRPDLAYQSSSVLAGRFSIRQVQKTYKSHLAALQLFKRVTVATQRLLDHIRTVSPDAEVLLLPNGLSRWWLTENADLGVHNQRENHLLYLPGTSSHDQDFRTIAKHLQDLTKQKPGLKLKLVGPLNIDPYCFQPATLVRGPEWVEFDTLPRYISAALACLAPLADTEFNQCKSHIKFLESAAFGTPVIASPIPDMVQHSVEGLMFPGTLAEWRQSLKALNDPEYFNHCSKELYNYVHEHCTNERHIPELVSFYSEGKAPDSSHEQIRYTPTAITLGTDGHRVARKLLNIKRKFSKFRHSPRHFFHDSRMYKYYRAKTSHHSP